MGDIWEKSVKTKHIRGGCGTAMKGFTVLGGVSFYLWRHTRTFRSKAWGYRSITWGKNEILDQLRGEEISSGGEKQMAQTEVSQYMEESCMAQEFLPIVNRRDIRSPKPNGGNKEEVYWIEPRLYSPTDWIPGVRKLGRGKGSENQNKHQKQKGLKKGTQNPAAGSEREQRKAF